MLVICYFNIYLTVASDIHEAGHFFSGDIPFSRQPVIPTAHSSDGLLFRQPIIPTNRARNFRRTLQNKVGINVVPVQLIRFVNMFAAFKMHY